MMDHVTRHSKDKERTPGPGSQGVNESDESVDGSYYYDDSSNYEVYQDEVDDEDDDSVSQRSPERPA